jgi:uncharacterized protein (TIGR02145 family)
MRHFPLFLFTLVITSCLLSCKKNKDNEPVYSWQIDSIYDIDSNVYTIVKIGEKWWMAEDLRTTRFRDSSLITQVQAQSAWLGAASAYCVFQSNPQALSLLYNFSAVTDPRGIAPLGWHIATDEEWKEVEKFAGMSNTEAEAIGWRGENKVALKLKTEDRKGWLVAENTWPKNNTGLSLSGIGGRVHNGAWTDPGLFSQGFWWTSDKSGARAFYRHLDFKYNEVFRDKADLYYGMAIRCVKD